MEITNPLLYSVPLFIILIVVEFLFSLKYDRHLYEWKDFSASVWVAVGAGVLSIFTKIMSFGIYTFFYESLKEVRLEVLGYESLGWGWWVWALAILVDDFIFYWHHRWNHTVRILWASHMVHHSSKRYNFGTAIRNGWFILFYKSLFWIWMPALGFDPLMVVTVNTISVIYQFFLHTKFVPSLGFLEKIFNTPKLHQVHHACNIEYLDKNHAGMLIIWDKLFGTYQPIVKEVEPAFGLVSDPDSYNPLVIVSYEYTSLWKDLKKAKSWKEKFKYVFYPPGWSPDNSTKTAKQLQEELQQRARQRKEPVAM